MSTQTFVVTTPTGVDVELAIAGPGSRAYAFIIDWHIRALVAVGWLAGFSWLFTKVWPATEHRTTGLKILFAAGVIVPPFIIYFLYHPILELMMRGRTPGKRMAGVRIVDRQGGTPSAIAVLIRNALRLIDCLPFFYCLGLCTTIFNAQRLRFGDMAAGTLLVHDGGNEAKALMQLGSLAIGSSLDAGTVALGNDLLLRWKDLDPVVRRRLSQDLLARMAASSGASAAPAANDMADDTALQQRLRNGLAGLPI